MALPTPDELKTMGYFYQGQPFIDVPATSDITLGSMQYFYQGQPFVSNEGGAVPPVTISVGLLFGCNF